MWFVRENLNDGNLRDLTGQRRRSHHSRQIFPSELASETHVGANHHLGQRGQLQVCNGILVPRRLEGLKLLSRRCLSLERV